MDHWTDRFRPPAVRTEIARLAFPEGHLEVALTDGRVLRVPLSWFPVLANAEPAALERYEISDGRGIHWAELDEDIHLEGLLRLFDGEPRRHPGRIHVYCYWDDVNGRWRAHWTADSSRAWLGGTPEEAIERARAGLARADTEYDLPAMVVEVEVGEGD